MSALQRAVGRGEVSTKVARQFADADDVGGSSRDAGFARYVGSTSADGKRLTRDEASSTSRGEVPHTEIDHRTNQKSKSAGFSNPRSDWGPKDLGHINAKRNRREFPSESRVSKRNADQHWLTKYASVSRAKKSSANEWHPGAWYGDPEGRQER